MNSYAFSIHPLVQPVYPTKFRSLFHTQSVARSLLGLISNTSCVQSSKMRCVLCIILYIVIQWYKHQCRYQDLMNLPLEDPLRQVVEVIGSKLSVNPFSHGSTACADGKRQGTSAESWWQGSGWRLQSRSYICIYLYIIYIYVMSYKISYNKYTRWCRVIQLYWLALNDYIYTQRFFLHVEVVCKLERLPFAVAPPRAFASKPMPEPTDLPLFRASRILASPKASSAFLSTLHDLTGSFEDSETRSKHPEDPRLDPAAQQILIP